MCFIMKTCDLTRIKTEKKNCVLEFNQSPYIEFTTQKRIEAGKDG